MDEIEVNGHAGGLTYGAEAEDAFAIPPPLDASLLFDDPENLAEQNEETNPQDNDDGDQTEDSAAKKKRRRISKPRVNLNEERLCSEKGLQALKNLCSEVHFQGKGHEVSDLNKLLLRFEHWAQCLMPSWPFKNVVEKCELLGSTSRVKSELKRIRNDDEAEVLRGEPEDDAMETEQADKSVEETSTEATSQNNVSQEEQPPDELSEEQIERIRRNRLLAFEKRQAKRRQLEESQTQSQLDNGPTNVDKEMNQENFSSKPPSVMNASSENIAPEREYLEDMVTGETHEDTAIIGDQNTHFDSPFSPLDLQAGGDMDDKNNEAELNNVPESAEQHNVSKKNGSSQKPNTINEPEQENYISDEDDDVLSRSAFDLNPASSEADDSLCTDTNNEQTTKKDEQLQDA